MVEKRFYTLDEAAEMLGLSEDELNDRAKKGEIRGFRDTGGFKFKVELIDELVANGSVKPAEAAADDDLMPLDDDDLVELDAEETVDLDGDVLEDDDLVLGGSGTGSGITLGGDSGISLVDPADSGLLLEEPLDLGGSDVESLTLGEVDDLGFEDDGEIAGTSGISGADEEFLLEPTTDLDDLDESESGSQVIPLDVDGDDDAATMVGGAFEDEGFATLEEDGEFADATELPQADGGQYVDPEILAQLEEAQLDEKPYSAGVIAGLVVCVIPMVLCGLFALDLIRTMWSWDAPYSLNSDMMETVLGWFSSNQG